MGNFNKEDRFGGKKRFDNDPNSSRGDRSDKPSMHRAVCSKCGKECEVPFKPTGDKPVFCNNCFGKKEGSDNSRFGRRDSGRPNFGSKQMFSAICSKCGKECEVPFKPTGDKPVFCNNCFGRGGKGGGSSNIAGSDQYKKQFEILNNKLDNILKILSSQSSIKKEVKLAVEATKKTVEQKIKAKKIAVPKKMAALKKAVKKVVAKKKK